MCRGAVGRVRRSGAAATASTMMPTSGARPEEHLQRRRHADDSVVPVGGAVQAQGSFGGVDDRTICSARSGVVVPEGYVHVERCSVFPVLRRARSWLNDEHMGRTFVGSTFV